MSRLRVTASTLNVRSAPTTEAGIVGRLSAGDTVETRAAADSGPWKAIRTAGGVAGWVHGSYLVPAAEPEKPQVDRDLTKLAPKFRKAVESALAELRAQGIDAVVNEALRSDALQRIYFKRGVTKARTVAGSWHGFGLAVDVISKAREWDVWPWRAKDGTLRGGDPHWWKTVVATFKRHGCDWGGDWQSIFDAPHFQWNRCRPSPGPQSRALFAAGTPFKVWGLVDAE